MYDVQKVGRVQCNATFDRKRKGGKRFGTGKCTTIIGEDKYALKMSWCLKYGNLSAPEVELDADEHESWYYEDEHTKKDWIGSESLMCLPWYGDSRIVKFFAGTNTEVKERPAPVFEESKSTSDRELRRSNKAKINYSDDKAFMEDADVEEEEQRQLSIKSLEEIGKHLDLIENNPEEFKTYAGNYKPL